MNIIDRIFKKKAVSGTNIVDREIENIKKSIVTEQKIDAEDAAIASAYFSIHGGGWNQGQLLTFDGEKNMGGIGPVSSYLVDYGALRARSWKAVLDSELAQTVLSKFRLWIIGTGLRLQSEPAIDILKQYKINIDLKEFTASVESRFRLYANSVNADYSGMQTLNEMAGTVFDNSKVGGDVLCILRYIDGETKVQVIDGEHVCNPLGSGSYIQLYTNGNIIKNGIEIDKRGRHVAYHVRTQGLESGGTNDIIYTYDTVRVPAVSESSGMISAFMVYGKKYRIDNVRGIPLLSPVMETLTHLERYKEATLSSAEENVKVVRTIEHGVNGSGDDPGFTLGKIARGVKGDQLTVDVQGNAIAKQVQMSTNNQTFNLPPDSKMKAFISGKELYFKDFYTVNTEGICATVGIPYPVAMSKYDSSYSSSRAAIKDWEHTINANRRDFYFQFYSKVYAFWLDVKILSGEISAPGYISARVRKDNTVLEAYRAARFVGAAVPHIDPEKEVRAERLKLGERGANLPLTTAEAASENLNSGDYNANLVQFSDELKIAEDLGVKTEVIENSVQDNADTEGEE